MKVVIQRVKKAKVSVDSQLISQIAKGMLVFLCVENDDSKQDADYLVNKLINLRIFEDDKKKMNLSIQDIKGEFLVISQFTLAGDCSKGRRPSFVGATSPQKAEELYNYFVENIEKSSLTAKTGKFRAMMDIALINDGPVTFILNSRNV